MRHGIRKVVSLVMIVWLGALLFSCTGVAASASGAAKISLLVDGKNVNTDTPPLLSGGRVLVPFRTIFEALGAQVTWDGEKQTAIGYKGQICIILRPFNNNAVIDVIKAGFNQEITLDNLEEAVASSRNVALDVPAALINGRLMVPVRFISESLGADVKWDENSETVSITTTGGSAPETAGAPTAQPGQGLIGTWTTYGGSLEMTIAITFKVDGTFKKDLAINSSISDYAEVTNGNFKIDDGNITYYDQTYASANGYWKHSGMPGYEELGNLYLEGNRSADDKTESISFKDDNHVELGGVEYTRFTP